MKRTICPFPARNNLRPAWVALIALGAMATAAGAAPSARPQIGGTLRVEMSERIASIDPRQWPLTPALSSAAERVDSLVFDRLIRLGEHGTLQPALAISWQHDEQSKRWEFRLRDGVKFSDGTPLTPPIAALALQQLLGASFDVSATPDSVVILTENSLPNFPR
jgi:peptide/nickel transport system substrate-binding protein